MDWYTYWMIFIIRISESEKIFLTLNSVEFHLNKIVYKYDLVYRNILKHKLEFESWTKIWLEL